MAEAPTTEADTICVTPEIAFGMGLWITTSAPTRTEAENFKGKKRRQKITKDMNT